jgi:metal-responsive CopG/Arc/MetJ family transcriptional regulator
MSVDQNATRIKYYVLYGATGEPKMSQMKSIAIKLPDSAITELKAIADAQYIPTRTMIRTWIMQRLEEEKKRETGGEEGIE